MYQGFFDQSYTYKVGDYAPENYLLEKYPENSKYSSKLTKKNANDNNKVTGDAYMIGKPEDDEVITKMIFDGTAAEENGVKSYWLASPGVSIYSASAGFGPGAVSGGFAGSGSGTFASGGYWNADGFAVRPVVSLSSKVTVEEIEKTDGTEEEWNEEGPISGVLESRTVNCGKIN